MFIHKTGEKICKKAHAIYSFNENYVLGGFYISNPLNNEQYII
jgi:hypothetical protein